MKVQTAEQAKEVIDALSDSFTSEDADHISQFVQDRLFSFWQRGTFWRLVRAIRRRQNMHVTRITYTVHKVELLVAQFPEICDDATTRSQLFGLSSLFRDVTSKYERRPEVSGLWKNIISFDHQVYESISNECEDSRDYLLHRLCDDSALIGVYKHGLVQSDDELTEDAAGLVLEKQLLTLQGDVLYIDPSIGPEIDDTILADLISRIPAPEEATTEVYLSECKRLSPQAVGILLQWCPRLSFPDLAEAPWLADTPIELRDRDVLVNQYVLERCPYLRDFIQAESRTISLRNITVKQWGLIQAYIFTDKLLPGQSSVDTWLALCEFPCLELIQSFGRQVGDNFLKHCWEDPLNPKILAEGLAIAQLARKNDCDDISRKMAAYLSYCLGAYFRNGVIPTPCRVKEKDMRVVRVILLNLTAFHLSAFADEVAEPRSPFGSAHISRVKDRLYLLYWIARNAPHLNAFVTDPLLPIITPRKQMQTLSRHFPDQDILRIQRGHIAHSADGRTIIIPTKCLNDLPELGEEEDA